MPDSALTPSEPIRLCVVVTVDITLINLCRGRFEYLTDHGFDITAVCAPTSRAAEIEARGIRLHTAPLTRRITPLQDARALWNLARFFRREKFDLVEVSTPKAALVGSIAAQVAGVPHVVHLLRGLAYVNQTGPTARLLRQSARIPCRIAERTIAVSNMTLDRAIRDGVCPPDRGVVLGPGSSNGIDCRRFSPATESERAAARKSLGLDEHAVVAGFVGRITRDKGVVELVDAYCDLAKHNPDLHLMLVGIQEERDRPPDDTLDTIASHPRIHAIGWQADTRRCMAAMDFFVLPTHREGFGTVLLEASAIGLAVITTDESGWWGALVKNEDALDVAVGDVVALRQAIDRLASDPRLRRHLCESARQKVCEHFDCQRIWALQEQEFRRIVGR